MLETVDDFIERVRMIGQGPIASPQGNVKRHQRKNGSKRAFGGLMVQEAMRIF